MLAASINLFTYWGVGIPTAFAFGFPAGLGLRVAGFWYSRFAPAHSRHNCPLNKTAQKQSAPDRCLCHHHASFLLNWLVLF